MDWSRRHSSTDQLKRRIQFRLGTDHFHRAAGLNVLEKYSKVSQRREKRNGLVLFITFRLFFNRVLNRKTN
ncbi:hypothetical protein [Synechococcus sp. M16CYN]|uniref:hypothetical protein n=1 Tax=Synechococcus sp. M16CYN TaxID=3103139 RepID=UPI003341C314